MTASDGADEALILSLETLTLGQRVLLAGAGQSLARAVRDRGGEATVWSRWVSSQGKATPWPAGGPYSSAIIRLPRSREELDMMLHAVAGCTSAGGIICVYGGNDEGIKSSAKRMAFLGDVDVVSTRRHSRVLAVRRPEVILGLKAALSDWRHEFEIELGGERRRWVSYPGLFAHGRLDDGTALLIDALPRLRADAHVADFACGTGIVAAAVRTAHPDAQLELIDADMLALEAARENVADARHTPGADLHAARGRTFDLIVSNPPLHTGKADDLRMLRRLIDQAPERMAPKGTLLLVAPSRLAVAPLLEARFEAIESVMTTPRYQVLLARQPKPTTAHPPPAAARKRH